MLRVYEAYGIKVRTSLNFAFPESEPSKLGIRFYEKGPDFFSKSSKQATKNRKKDWFYYSYLRDDSVYLQWTDLFQFQVSRDGNRVYFCPLSRASLICLETYLLTHVLSFSLIAQAVEPLHSTVVSTGNEAIAFLGDCGYGKSSLGAAFLQAGFSLVTDDLLVVRMQGSSGLALPGLPRVKLFPKMAQHLLSHLTDKTPMNPFTRKSVLSLSQNMWCRSPVPLKAIYILSSPREKAERISIDRLSSGQSCVELIKSTFNNVVVEPARLGRQLLAMSEIAAHIPIKLLSFPRDLKLIPEVRKAILADVGA